jgi:hypothetical protein
MFRKKKASSKSAKNVSLKSAKKSSAVDLSSSVTQVEGAKSKLSRAQTAPDGVSRRARTETSPPALDSSRLERASDLVVVDSSAKTTKKSARSAKKGKSEKFENEADENDEKEASKSDVVVEPSVAELDHRSEGAEEGFSWGSSDDDDDERPKLNVKIRKSKRKADDEVIDAQLAKAASFLEMPASVGSSDNIASGSLASRRRGRRQSRMQASPSSGVDFFASAGAAAVAVASAATSDPKFEEARAHVKQSHEALEKADYDEALRSIDLALRLLGTFDSVRVELVRYCVAYKLALHLLVRIYASPPSDDASSKTLRYEQAHLARVLADMPLQPHHRVVCIRIALERNMSARNYGIGASLVRILLPRNPGDKASLQQVLTKCRKHSEANKHLQAPSAVSEYSSFERRLCVSAHSFTPVDSNAPTALLQCSICLSILLPVEPDNVEHSVEQSCPTCSIGSLFVPT